MNPVSDEPGWFTGHPKSSGRYLIVDADMWQDRTATWIAGTETKPGRWWPDGGQPCDASGVAYFRPLPRIPARQTPSQPRDDSRTIVKD